MKARHLRGHRFRAVLVVAGAVCLVAAGTGWLGIRGMSARDHLQRAAVLVAQLQEQLKQTDPAAPATLAALRAETRAAGADTADPAWRLGTHAPGVGRDLAAVRTVADSLDDFTRDGLTPLVGSARLVDLATLTPRHGRIDVTALRKSAPALAAADAALGRARDRIDAINLDGLARPLRSALAGLRDDLRRASALTAIAAHSAALLPAMLGADGPRDYLVLFQNLAEVRATGGMPGAYVVVRADHGKVGIADQGSAATDLRVFGQPVLPLSDSDRQLYTSKLGRYPADINLTPDFPTTGALAREMYRRRTGRTVDGVLATDPVALAHLLGAIGPVPVPGGTALTATNAVSLLLSRTYALRAAPEDQDRYFAAAAKAVFQAVMDRPMQPAALLSALDTSAGERRLLVWSARPAENQLLAGTVLAGVLPASDGEDPTVGVFLNDGSGAKLGYYLTHSATLAVAPDCRTDGRRELTLRVTLGSTAPASGLPDSVTGLGLSGDPYTVRTNVAVYSSTGGSILGMTLNGRAVRFGSGTDRRRAVGIMTVDLPPGTRRTLDVLILTGIPAGGYGATVTPRLWTTPGVSGWDESVQSADGCPSGR